MKITIKSRLISGGAQYESLDVKLEDSEIRLLTFLAIIISGKDLSAESVEIIKNAAVETYREDVQEG